MSSGRVGPGVGAGRGWVLDFLLDSQWQSNREEERTGRKNGSVLCTVLVRCWLCSCLVRTASAAAAKKTEKNGAGSGDLCSREKRKVFHDKHNMPSIL